MHEDFNIGNDYLRRMNYTIIRTLDKWSFYFNSQKKSDLGQMIAA
jgi:hypothetical protein